MTKLIKTFAAVVASTVLATSALAQSVREEHHVAKIDGTRFHYVTAGTGDLQLTAAVLKFWQSTPR